MSFIFRFDDPPREAELGGKARSLAALRGKDLSIPDGFVVLPHAFEASLPEAGRRALLEADERTDAILARIQPAPSVIRELSEALADLSPPGEPVAVRSSALEEDGCDYSFAGQLESFLFVRPEEVAGKVAAVWRSAFSVRLRAYRSQHQLPATPRPPAVLIQRMIHAEIAGVAFGADPVTGRQDLAVVSAVKGLGTALVNGESDADTWHVGGSGEIVQRQLANQRRAHRSDDGAHRHTTVLEDPQRPALDDAQVRAVAELVRRTGEVFGCPQDIEWAIEKGRLYLLQSRPITSITRRGKLNIWDNSNIIESYSGVTLPLTFSFARRAYAGVYRQFCQLLAVPKARIAAHEDTFHHMLGLIRGRVYYNLLNWYRVLALLPGFTLNRRFMEQMMGLKEELPEEILAELGHAGLNDRLKDAFSLAFSLTALVANHFLLPRKIRRFYERLNHALTPPARPLEVMTADDLCAYFLRLEKKLLTHWDAPLLNDFFAMIFHGVLRRLAAKWVEAAVGPLQNDLLCGEGGMISAEPAARIRELAELVSANAGLVKQLCDDPPDAIFATMEQVPKFKSAFLEYLARFGDRCLEELKLESRTLHDDPMLLLRSVGQLARSRASNGVDRPPIGKADARRRAEARVHQALARHPLRRVLFRLVVRHTRARVRDRENLRFERTRLFGRVRQIFVELGRRLQAEGHLRDPRDVFLLEVDEVLGFVAGTAATTRLKELVALRRKEFSEYRAAEPPPNRFTTHGIVNRSTPLPGTQQAAPTVEGFQRKGIGCCPGVVRGRVHKIADPRNALIQAGEILVAERTDPGWVMLFPAAAGLLVERGSLLSHSAIVARELGIPAIVSIDGLMNWLNDGDEVEFDGSTGILQRIEGSGAARDGAPSSIQPMGNRILSINAGTAELTTIAS